MGPTACTEPQCLYKGGLYFYFIICTFDMTHWNDLGALAKHQIYVNTFVTHCIHKMTCSACHFYSIQTSCSTYFTVWYIISAVDCVRIHRQIKQ
jgi:hypothetical protein